MRTVLAIAVITCLFVVGLAQNQQCNDRADELSSCISRLATAGDSDTFCSDCGNSLVSFYQDCGRNVDTVRRRKLKIYYAIFRMHGHALHVQYKCSIITCHDYNNFSYNNYYALHYCIDLK